MHQEQLQEEIDIPRLEHQLQTLEKFSDADTLKFNEEDWNNLSQVHYNFQKEGVSLLDGGALRVLNADLIKAMETVDMLDFAHTRISELYANAYKDYVIPITLRQPATPNTMEKQGINYVHAVGLQFLAYSQKWLEATKKLLQVLEQYNYHK